MSGTAAGLGSQSSLDGMTVSTLMEVGIDSHVAENTYTISETVGSSKSGIDDAIRPRESR
jgi:hypothetical protein